MSETTEIRGHDELELILPWYVNGTLDKDEHAAVMRHVQVCDECRHNISLLQRMQHAATSESPSPIVPRQDLQGLFERLDVHEQTRGRLTSWAKPRVLAAGAAIVALGLALLLANRYPEMQEPQLFETATSANAVAASGYVIAVRFEPATKDARQNEIIAAFGGTYIGPGEQPYSSRVAVSLRAATLEELAGFTREVELNPEVVSVQVVAVQLPVE